MASDEPRGDYSPDSTSLPADETLVSHEQVTDNAYLASDYTYGSSHPGNGGTSSNIPGHTMPFVPTPAAPGSASPTSPLSSTTTSTVSDTAVGMPRRPIPSSASAIMTGAGGGGHRSLPPPPDSGDGDEEDSGMLRMSFLEHLEELRTRLFYALGGFAVAFLVSLTFCQELWRLVSAPAVEALKALKVNPPNLSQITPMEAFNVIWVKTPVLASIFLASPWLLYQVWAFVSPGLYKKERKWAVPFVVSTAGLFITGGLFAYFVAFRYGLTFLLGIGRDVNVTPLVSINEYFDLFVNVTLGIGLVFELPILIFFLTLLRLVTPSFLIKNSRYAILIIVIIAAVVTPTPDIFNLLLFATPMILLFYVGIFASYLLVLKREGRRLPWTKISLGILLLLILLGAVGWYLSIKLHYYFVPRWPFFVH